jgi:hypothetical protein
MVGADHPDRAGWLQHTPAGRQPGARERVIALEIGESVPGLINAVDARLVGAVEVAGELQIVGRIGEDEIDALRRQFLQGADAIAGQDAIRLEELRNDPFPRPRTHHATPDSRGTGWVNRVKARLENVVKAALIDDL